MCAPEPARHRSDSDHPGMRWIDGSDGERSVCTWLRVDPTSRARPVFVAVNASPTPQYNLPIGVPPAGRWAEPVNTDAVDHGGSGVGNGGGVPVSAHGFPSGALFPGADDGSRPDGVS